jgi:hypothetical protein
LEGALGVFHPQYSNIQASNAGSKITLTHTYEDCLLPHFQTTDYSDPGQSLSVIGLARGGVDVVKQES